MLLQKQLCNESEYDEVQVLLTSQLDSFSVFIIILLLQLVCPLLMILSYVFYPKFTLTFYCIINTLSILYHSFCFEMLLLSINFFNSVSLDLCLQLLLLLLLLIITTVTTSCYLIIIL